MKDLIAYLMFDGNCREAMQFYEKCLSAELNMFPFSEAPMDIPAEGKERIMHARLTKGSATLMASDTMIGTPLQKGNNFSVSMNCESVEEAEKLFASLGEKGTVTMALQDTFWGAHFGMLTDQFGVNWMFNFDRSKQG